MSDSTEPETKKRQISMGLITGLTVAVAFVAAGVSAHPSLARRQYGNLTTSQTSLTFLYNNNLNFTDDANHIGAILLDPVQPSAASDACTVVGESLLTQEAIQAHSGDFVSLLSYQSFAGRALSGQSYQISEGTVRIAENYGAASLQFGPASYGYEALPVLCTQSSTQNMPSNAQATTTNRLTIASGSNSFTGFRNQKSFRFLGIPYANPVGRFEYSTLSTATGQAYDTTKYGGQCAQPYNSGSVEDCLFLNIQTPYLPRSSGPSNTSDSQLRPVHFWIHGGGFTGGTGSDAGSDGGQISSREDVVVVTINYRLTTLGFLAIPGTDIKGNYGIGDQITALQWVRDNIASFGGDPNKIVINGESAGAGSVRTLLGSPPARGLFRGAIIMSNLGGGQTLGLSGDYSTTYSQYLTVDESYARAGQQIFTAVGCNQTTLDEQIACLKTIPAQTIVNLATVARYVVQDGTIVNTPNLDVANKVNGAANVNTIWGIVAEDGASFSTYPKTPVSSLQEALTVGLGISTPYAQSIIDSGLFPYTNNTGNLTLDTFNVTARVATDKQFRCIDQATVYAGVTSGAFKTSYFYEMERARGGYNPNNVDGTGPVEAGYPNGNPEKPYFKLHGADMPWVFGNLYPLRDEQDLLSTQLTTAYFGAFVRNLDPNPGRRYLEARGYGNVIRGTEESGEWEAVEGDKGPIKALDTVSRTREFKDLEQCAFLNYTISYYLDGGK
ncbi:Carboxylesterase-like protein 6 [Elsinoe fawcettii]|nr:Carboxylesterase-like protein 6 [Elsinoe fawcettii]